MIRLITGLFGITDPRKEKISIKMRGGKFIYAYIPNFNSIEAGMISQRLACYEIKLNGHPMERGLG